MLEGMDAHPAIANLPRQCRVLAGERAWAWALLEDWLAGCPGLPVLWLGQAGPPGREVVRPRHAEHYLGSECAVLVFDAHEGLHPDRLAAALGTLRGGGLLCLLVPGGADWPDRVPGLERLAPWPLDGGAVARRLLWRLRDGLVDLPGARLLTPGAVPDWPRVTPPSGAWRLNPQQQAAVQAIGAVAEAPSAALVLTADRGRGKSTAIGEALGRLLNGGKRVWLCAPSRAAVASLYARLHQVCPRAAGEGDTLRLGGGRLEFLPPQALLARSPDCDLLVIDEAAALGLGTLKTLVPRHPRLVFSTTVHGYEGSGRGFLVRFLDWLAARTPELRRLSLDRPVRWAPGDPLETWLNRALLLDAEPRPAGAADSPCLEWLRQDALARDEALLRQVFGLLVSAHYQTRPSDLQQLLDGPGVRILVARQGPAVCGVALLVEEGGFPRDLAEAVHAGRRRPRGHMLLQSLSQHAGWGQAPRLRAWRVMRIAVQAGLRRRGLGSALLRAVERQARARGLDLLGTAFGLEAGVLRFWLSQGYRPARLGQRVDPASGAHSVFLLKGLSPQGRALQAEAHAAFARDLSSRPASGLPGLPPDARRILLRG